jgi:hypothetical protein
MQEQQWAWMRRLDWMQRDFLDLLASAPGAFELGTGRWPLRRIAQARRRCASTNYLQPPLQQARAGSRRSRDRHGA